MSKTVFVLYLDHGLFGRRCWVPSVFASSWDELYEYINQYYSAFREESRGKFFMTRARVRRMRRSSLSKLPYLRDVSAS